MKTTLTLFIALISVSGHSQTAIIAHKSHSGNSSSFFTDPNTNFGEPGPTLYQTIYINDSTYVRYIQDWGTNYISVDTIRTHKTNNAQSMSVALSKPARISPNEFERDTAKLNKKILQQKDSLQPEMKVEPSTPQKNKSKKSSLPWILVLSVIGFFGTKRILAHE
jgi:hypothetical protein